MARTAAHRKPREWTGERLLFGGLAGYESRIALGQCSVRITVRTGKEKLRKARFEEQSLAERNFRRVRFEKLQPHCAGFWNAKAMRPGARGRSAGVLTRSNVAKR